MSNMLLFLLQLLFGRFYISVMIITHGTPAFEVLKAIKCFIPVLPCPFLHVPLTGLFVHCQNKKQKNQKQGIETQKQETELENYIVKTVLARKLRKVAAASSMLC